MDFASILSAEISKKRKSPLPTDAPTTESTDAKPKKYLKRSELEEVRRAAYEAEQERLAADRAQKAAEKAAAAEAEAQRRAATKEKQARLAEERRKREEEKRAAAEGEKMDVDAEEEVLDAEVIARLRALEQPARLFGESAVGRLKRLRRVESSKEREEEKVLSEEEMVLDLADVGKDDAKVYRQLDAWFRLVLAEWDKALEERPIAVKESFQGKAAKNAMVQAKEYMKPLFRHFKNRDLHSEVFGKVCEIVAEAQRRRYVKANDVYLRLSIGNAAWPIGVTMVGIHERSAREKLHEKGMAAHIMSDEVTRKFLQSIKRCLTFCQTRWQPEDPLQLMG
ncbi:hypothetical protein RUND412_009628 [Rhizina undulata]